MTDTVSISKSVPIPTFRVAELRVKIRSLAVESTIIRHEEIRALRARRGAVKRSSSDHASHHGATYESLHAHRIGVVRPAARAAQLALAYLRARPYASAERATWAEGFVGETQRVALAKAVAENVGRFMPRLMHAQPLEVPIRKWIEAVAG